MAQRWGYSFLMWPKKLSIQAWSVGVPGRPKCSAMAHRAMNSRVEPDVIWRPLAETANRSSQDPSHRGGRHPQPVEVGAPVGELAMRAVHVAPLVIEGDDLGHLVGHQAVHRTATRRPVGQLAGGSTLDPPVGAALAQLELP